MSMTLDEIYDSFIWDESYTDEEYEAKISVGINEARKFKYLYPFIQPVIPGKVIWEPCARVLALKSDEELEPYLLLLFEWLQDVNWPGGWTIYDRLLKMSFSMLKETYDYCVWRATKESDDLWLSILEDLKKEIMDKAVKLNK